MEDWNNLFIEKYVMWANWNQDKKIPKPNFSRLLDFPIDLWDHETKHWVKKALHPEAYTFVFLLQGFVYVKSASPEAATKASQALHGRWFAGNDSLYIKSYHMFVFTVASTWSI